MKAEETAAAAGLPVNRPRQLQHMQIDLGDLESVIENHDGEDVVNLAKKKWEQIIEKKQSEKVESEKEESTIEIGETLDYEINYSDLEIEEEIEN